MSEEVIYPEIECVICDGDDAITFEKAKQLLGWQTEKEAGVKFGEVYLFRDHHGEKIRCHNNLDNRPLYQPSLLALKQEHLRNRWELNGEAIIIGRTGKVLNGQHSLISLCLAVQEYEQDSDKWTEYRNSVPVMEKLVTFGIDESDRVVNTMDTCKPRSLLDVVFRSEYFDDLKVRYRKQAAQATDYAVRLLWERTGVTLDGQSSRTHSESLDFINRHPTLLKCVRKVLDISGKEQTLKGYISLGYASALLYMMASSKSDLYRYIHDGRREESLDFGLYERACDFWDGLGDNLHEFDKLRKGMARLISDNMAQPKNRLALLIKAWERYAEDKPIRVEDCKLVFIHQEGVAPRLNECPTTGGIDIGDPHTFDMKSVKPSKK